MSKMLWFQDAEKEEQEEQERRSALLKAHKPLFQIAMEYGYYFSHKNEHDWSDKDRATTMCFAMGGGTINCLALDLHLGENDSIIKDVGPIIEDLKEHPHLKFRETSDYIDAGWKGWDFDLKNGNGTSPKASLKVRAWFETSTKCKKVGTGKFEEKMKIVCEE